jgi:hypothetical protein
MRPASLLVLLTSVLSLHLCTAQPHAEVEGTLRRWHPVTVTFDGPQAAETGTPNPFRDFRLTVTFSHAATDTRYAVPGYFAADGDAAETSATEGTKWRAHFTPPETGTWAYTASFRTGPDVAMGLEAHEGTPAGLRRGPDQLCDRGGTPSNSLSNGRATVRLIVFKHLDAEIIHKCNAL